MSHKLVIVTILNDSFVNVQYGLRSTILKSFTHNFFVFFYGPPHVRMSDFLQINEEDDEEEKKKKIGNKPFLTLDISIYDSFSQSSSN